MKIHMILNNLIKKDKIKQKIIKTLFTKSEF